MMMTAVDFPAGSPYITSVGSLIMLIGILHALYSGLTHYPLSHLTHYKSTSHSLCHNQIPLNVLNAFTAAFCLLSLVLSASIDWQLLIAQSNCL